MKPKSKIFYFYLFVAILSVFMVSIIPGCNNEEDEVIENESTYGDFAYFISNTTYTSTIHLLNEGQSIMEAKIYWYDPLGSLISQETRMLESYEISHLTRDNFTGWVRILGIGSWAAVEPQMEIRRNDNNGLALVRPCTGPGPLGNLNWYYLLGVTDLGPGQDRTTIITYNSHPDISIFVEYIPLVPFYCGLEYEVEIPPRGQHTFKPMDVWGEKFPYGIVDTPIYVGAHTGPDRTGDPTGSLSGALFFEKPNGDFGVINHKSKSAAYGYRQEELRTACLIDVRDNGTTRSDRIYFKDNNASNYPAPSQTYFVHFYDYLGIEMSGSPKSVDLTHHFDLTGSHTVISPMELLGQPFSGSIWITPQEPCTNCNKIRVQILRQWPGKWTDWDSDAPGRGSDTGFSGVISYISSPADPWKYYLAFFYPESLYLVEGDPEITTDTFGEAGTTPPEAENGVVVLTFRNEIGNERGWYAFLMQPNETRVFNFNQLVSAHLGTFTGSICFQPMIPAQLEKWHWQNKGHATVNYLHPAL